jgi:hypothetical protein
VAIMPFREKSAWGSLLSVLIGYGIYFTILIPRLAASPDRPPPYLALLFGCVFCLIVVQIALQTGIAIAMRDQARLPPDERERLIGIKSDRIAMAVLSTLVASSWLLTIAGPAFMANSAIIANLMLFALVAAAITKFASVIVYFHRGA